MATEKTTRRKETVKGSPKNKKEASEKIRSIVEQLGEIDPSYGDIYDTLGVIVADVADIGKAKTAEKKSAEIADALSSVAVLSTQIRGTISDTRVAELGSLVGDFMAKALAVSHANKGEYGRKKGEAAKALRKVKDALYKL